MLPLWILHEKKLTIKSQFIVSEFLKPSEDDNLYPNNFCRC